MEKSDKLGAEKLDKMRLPKLNEVLERYPLLKNYEIRRLNPTELRPDVRTRWKCMFGCDYYGKRKSCPPFVPEIDEAEKFLKSYSSAILFLVRFEDYDEYMDTKKQIQSFLVELEGKLVKEYPMVFTLFPGGCDLCDECAPNYEKCQARPTVSSVGIRISDLGVELGDKWLVSMILLE